MISSVLLLTSALALAVLTAKGSKGKAFTWLGASFLKMRFGAFVTAASIIVAPRSAYSPPKRISAGRFAHLPSEYHPARNRFMPWT